MIHTSYGPWALVTGASSGIGRAFAERLSADGLNVVLVGRARERLEEIGTRTTRLNGTDHRVVVADLSTPAGIDEVVRSVQGLDVGLLVSNAGDARPLRFLDESLEDLESQLQLNATSHLHLVHALAPPMAARGSGGIVLTSASGGYHGMPYLANTAAAKGYVFHLGEALHHELKQDGIDVLVLLPGNVDTPIVDRIGLSEIGIPLSLISPERAIKEAMRGLRRGKVSLVPGRSVRTMRRFLPRAMSVRMNGWLMARALDANRPDDVEQPERVGGART